jgi:hypothetical protein
VICIGGTAARNAGATALPSALGNSSIIAFVNQFSKTVAAQGITANVVHPPFTKTDRYPKRLAARAKQLGASEAEAEASFVKQFPIGRLIEPKDIAPIVLFLASPHASAITGRALPSMAALRRGFITRREQAACRALAVAIDTDMVRAALCFTFARHELPAGNLACGGKGLTYVGREAGRIFPVRVMNAHRILQRTDF